MATSELRAAVREREGVAVIDLVGDVNASAEDALNEAYTHAIEGGAVSVALNFEGADYINSTGIALIVSLLARARKAQRRLLASGLSQHYVEIFHITRLADYMDVYPDVGTALAQMPAPARSGS